jgi:hypothetical protein
MRFSIVLAALALQALLSWPGAVVAGGGPLGIDHRLKMDNGGLWARVGQQGLEYSLVGATIAGALWEGGETRLGKTSWQSIDASSIGAVSSEVMKRTFTRMRPSQTDDPDRWFEGGSNRSFPSGEVTAITAVITPFVLEYGQDYPAVYALELLPLFDGIARMKVRGHWQTDVLAGFALGSAAGYFAHSLPQPFVLGVMPHAVSVGLKKQF